MKRWEGRKKHSKSWVAASICNYSIEEAVKEDGEPKAGLTYMETLPQKNKQTNS